MEFRVYVTDYLGRLKQVIKYYQSRKNSASFSGSKKSKEIYSEVEIIYVQINLKLLKIY